MGGQGTGIRLCGLMLSWLAGVALQVRQAALWPPAWYAAAGGLALAFVLAAAAGRDRWPRAAWLGCWTAAAALAFGLTGAHAAWRLAQVLPDELAGQDVVLTGVVAELPRVTSDGTRFVFDVESAWHDDRPAAVPPRVSLGWYSGWRDDGAAAAEPKSPVRAGQRWRLTARLKPPHAGANPHGFDAELWMFEQGIRATGSVRTARDAVNELLDESAGHPFERQRQRVRDAVFAHVADPRAAGVLAALAIGDQGAIDRDDWDVFRDTGTAHLMAISGLHVTMFAWLAGALAGRLWRFSATLMLWVPAPVASRWCGLAAAAGYALLAGWGVPAQRTVWMLATAAILASASVRWPWTLVLLAAAVVVTALDPWALLQPGFWLSFAAVGLLLASEPAGRVHEPADGWRAKIAGLLRGGLRTQVHATLGLAPLTLVFFQQLSVVGFVANLLAIPLVTLVVTPLALLGAVAAPLWTAGAWMVQGMAQALAWMAALPGAVWMAPAAPLWAQLLGLLGGALFVLPLPWCLRALGVPLLLPLLWPPVARPAEGAFEVVAADVGQGNAVVVRTRRHLLVYDAGPRYSSTTDAGDRVLLPLLRGRGEAAVHTLVLSHRDADHVGGAASLIRGIAVREIVGSLEPGHELRHAGVPFTQCAVGHTWLWDGVRFDVLHPFAFDESGKPNGESCVVRVQGADGASLLLAGDVEAAQEADLVAAHGAGLKSDVLLVPHHGSKTSSTPAFLDAVAPRRAVVQAGWRNRFGHPAPPVVERYAARGIELVDSPSCGAWTWRAGTTTCERHRAARYWHHRPAPPGLP